MAMVIDELREALTHDVVGDLVALTWRTVLDVEVVPVGDVDVSDGDVAVDVMSATIAIAGSIDLTVVLEYRRTDVVHAAARVFGLAPEAVADADLRDAFGELANIVGGNVKGVLSDGDGTSLSLPVVAEGRQRVAGSRLLMRACFDCEGRPLVCELHTHA